MNDSPPLSDPYKIPAGSVSGFGFLLRPQPDDNLKKNDNNEIGIE